MIYRSAQARDAVKLAALSIEVWLHTYLKDGINSAFADYVMETFTPKYFRNLIDDQKRHIIICESGDNLLGYIALDFNANLPECISTLNATAEITTLYVRAHHAGRGIGKALMEQAESVATTRNISHIWLSVLHDNHRAVQFYQQQGLRKQGSIWFEVPGERHENYILVQSL